jgi:hypothetical protein
VNLKKVSTFGCTLNLSLELETEVEIITFTFKRFIRAEVATFRLDGAFGSLQTQQLRGFDGSRNDQGIIQNHRAKINTTVTSLYLPESSLSSRILRLAQKN